MKTESTLQQQVREFEEKKRAAISTGYLILAIILVIIGLTLIFIGSKQ